MITTKIKETATNEDEVLTIVFEDIKTGEKIRHWSMNTRTGATLLHEENGKRYDPPKVCGRPPRT